MQLGLESKVKTLRIRICDELLFRIWFSCCVFGTCLYFKCLGDAFCESIAITKHVFPTQRHINWMCRPALSSSKQYTLRSIVLFFPPFKQLNANGGGVGQWCVHSRSYHWLGMSLVFPILTPPPFENSQLLASCQVGLFLCSLTGFVVGGPKFNPTSLCQNRQLVCFCQLLLFLRCCFHLTRYLALHKLLLQDKILYK